MLSPESTEKQTTKQASPASCNHKDKTLKNHTSAQPKSKSTKSETRTPGEQAAFHSFFFYFLLSKIFTQFSIRISLVHSTGNRKLCISLVHISNSFASRKPAVIAYTAPSGPGIEGMYSAKNTI